MAPIAIPKTVIPTCTVLMNRTGSSMSRSARARAGCRVEPLLSRPRRAVTSAYSAATKTAFPSTSRNTMMMRRRSLTPRSPGRGYWAVARRPSYAEYR